VTREEYGRIVDLMPGGMDGFMKTWGLTQFADAVEASVKSSKWISFHIPPESPKGEHYPVTVLAAIDDSRFQLNGEDPFVDIVAYWPALKKWTCTHQCRADEDVVDYEVNVTWWQPMPEEPKRITFNRSAEL